DEPREEGVLRVSELPDGAVGRAGIRGVHGWQEHRRRAGPQRPPSVSLLRDERRSGHHGVRGRSAPIEPERILEKGRLQPGRMFLVSLEEGRIIGDTELKSKLAAERPYREWLDRNLIPLSSVPEAEPPELPDAEEVRRRQIAFGYSVEDIKYILTPMARNSEEAISSMGTDTPLAVLSDRPQPLYN